MTLPPFLQEQEGGLFLACKVQPRAHRTELAGSVGAELKLKVTAPPVDSAANEAVVEFLAEILGLPRRSVTLVRGQTTPHKIFHLAGVRAADVAARLSPAEIPRIAPKRRARPAPER